MPPPVHPRGRGEHVLNDISTSTSFGSSPRARGTLRVRFRACLIVRFIPAGAGNTRHARAIRAGRSVHPRGRGEHESAPSRSASRRGSSPRARGTRCCRVWLSVLMRFIPAGAGNTWLRAASPAPRAVHPRGRGEHVASERDTSSISGSSPRARGTRAQPAQKAVAYRFIPAGAGNTPYGGSVITASTGSSPRARGTPRGRLRSFQRRRFIPAGAGNTRGRRACSRCRSVHPRGRGEHANHHQAAEFDAGSSPRARGTPTASRWRSRGRTVHPRGRGEHTMMSFRSCSSVGSSPRARGTRGRPSRSARLSRFIPAGAGNTSRCPTRTPRPCGSSPRARGTPLAHGHRPALRRFIPAGAGNTLFHSISNATAFGSSPRARGTRRNRPDIERQLRFIPAGAGNTLPLSQ